MWILAFGGVGISLGVGRKKVIMTIGSESTGKMTSTFVEWIDAVTVLIASLRSIPFPVSTTHCQIGGVVGAGIEMV
jgi:phosphate/sulfate permease